MSVIGEKKKINIFGVADTTTELTTGSYLTNDTAELLYLRKSSASNTYVSDAAYSTSSASPLLSVSLAPNPSGSGRRVTIQDTSLQQLQLSVSGKQDALQTAQSGTPLLNGLKIRSLSASQNISLGVQDDVVTITGPNLSTYALTSTVNGKQDALQAVPSGTPLLNGLKVRSLSATRNVSLGVQDDVVTITGPDLSTYALSSTLNGKQDQLQAITSNTPLLNGLKLRALNATRNVSLGVSDDVVTITGPDLTTFASTSALSGKQDTLQPITTNTPLLNGLKVRALNSTRNVSLGVQDDVVTITGPDLAPYALASTLNGKQDALQAVPSGTPLLNSLKVRSLSATRNVSLGVQDDVVTITGPDLSTYVSTTALTSALIGKQDALQAVTTDTPLLSNLKIRALAASRNVSLGVQNDVVTITGPDLASYAPKHNPTFEGQVTASALSVISSFSATSTAVSTMQHLSCNQGFSANTITLGNNTAIGKDVLGGLLRCTGTGQTIPILTPSEGFGGFFDVIIANATTLTLTSDTFPGPAGSGTSSVTLSPIRSSQYRLTADGSNWRVHSVGSSARSVIVTGATTLGSEVFGGTVTVSGTSSYTITLPPPVDTAGAQFELMMNVGFPITIATPVGWIGGVSGGYESTKVLSVATTSQHNRFFSDGANWNMISQAGFSHFGDLVVPVRLTAAEIFLGANNITTLFQPRPWVQCVVNAGGGILSGSSVGQVTPTIARTSAGALDISFSSHPRSFNYTHSVQPRLDTGLAFAVVSNVLANSLKVRTHNASQALTDLQFSITIFS